MERDSLVGRHPVRRLPRRLPARSGRALGRAALRRQPGLRRQLGSLLRVDRSRDRTPPADAAGHPSGRAPPRARTRRAAAPPRAHEARPQEHQGRHRHRLRRPGTARLLERARLLQVRRLVSRGSPPHGGAMPQVSSNAGPQHQLAVFIDFENIALGLQGSARFDTRRVLDRMLERGKVIVKVAYADWNRFREYTQGLHENGIELIEIPRRATSGKNSADIRLCVDAMDLSWSKEHIDTFVIVSGDSDFSPLVAKLKENGKHVIGLGMKKSTSPLLANACDEFIYYEDLERGPEPVEAGAKPAHGKEAAFRLLGDTVRALQRENFDVIQASLVKDTMKRKRPAFSEAALGYGSFSELLEDAQESGVVTLRKDERSGTYVVTGVAAPEKRGRPRRARR